MFIVRRLIVAVAANAALTGLFFWGVFLVHELRGLSIAPVVLFPLLMMPGNILMLSLYELAIARQQSASASTETLCGRCGHILRGISKPQCPECGTWI